MSGSRAGQARLARGTGYMCGDGECHGRCANCGKYIERFAWQKGWVHENTGQPACAYLSKLQEKESEEV